MDLEWYLRNALSYCLQLCVLIGAAVLLEKLFPLRLPRLSYAYWRILLLACLILPLVEPWPAPIRISPGIAQAPVIEEIAASQMQTASPASGQWEIPYLSLLAALLGAGILFRFSRLLVGALSLHRALKRAQPVVLPWNMSQLAPGGGRQPRLCCVEGVKSPATYGVFRPVILLPTGFSQLTEAQQLGVICHELRHVQRHDWLFRLAEETTRCLFWFHPLVLWLTRRIELSREQSVDQEVVQILGQSRDYLDSLVEMASARLSGPVAALFLSESYLRQRVRLIKEGFTMSTRRLSISLALSLVVLLTAGTIAVWAFPMQGREQEQARPAGVPGGSSVEGLKRGPESDSETNLGAIKVGGNVQTSKLIHWVPPVYPPDAEKAGVKGMVIVKVTVTEAGDVKEVESVRGHPLLVDAALAAVRQWKYSPTMLNGRAVPVIATQILSFPPGTGPEQTTGQQPFMDPDTTIRLRLDQTGALFMGEQQLDPAKLLEVVRGKNVLLMVLGMTIPPSEPSQEVIENAIRTLERSGGRVYLASPSYSYADGRLSPRPAAVVPTGSLAEAAKNLGYVHFRWSLKEDDRTVTGGGSAPGADEQAHQAAVTQPWKTATYRLTLDAQGRITDVTQADSSVIPGVHEALSAMVGRTYPGASSPSIELQVSMR